MLPTGRSVVKQIFACDEGVMGFHNDRRANKNLPANGRAGVFILILPIIFYFFVHNLSGAVSLLKITTVSYILAAFRPVPQSCTSSTLLRHRTKIVSSHTTLSVTFIIKQALKKTARHEPEMGGGYYGRGLLRVGLFNLIFFTFFIFNKSRGHTGGWGWGGGTGMTPALFFWPSRLGALLLLQYPERPQRPVLRTNLVVAAAGFGPATSG